MTLRSDPFGEVLRDLVAERGTTLRQVSIATGISYTGVYKASRGELVPKPPKIEAIARVLEVPPETFAEYRLQVAQDALDWRRHGLAKALKALEK